MADHQPLDEYCGQAVGRGSITAEAARVIGAIAAATAEISNLVELGGLAGDLAATVGGNAGGDVQKALDVRAHAICRDALARAPVAEFASEEADTVEGLNSGAPFAVAIDPLDGSSNIDTNMSIGTIFSVVPAAGRGDLGAFGGPGTQQVAAGFAVYGPQTTLVLATAGSVDIFTFDRRDESYKRIRAGVRIAEKANEFAINASNHRHWQPPVRVFIDDCLNGTKGPRGADFNMRWIGSLVAEAFRILTRGGIFLYPADERPGYAKGRLRLLYEAAPIAFVVEQAGGLASTGRERILDVAAQSLHQRVPLIFGSADAVRHVERLHREPDLEAGNSPLFATRGLFRN